MKKLLVLMLSVMMAVVFMTGCGGSQTEESGGGDADKEAAQACADAIDAIYVGEWTEDTEQQCLDAKAKWDALTDEQKEMVEGEEADPGYFGDDTGDASKDDPLNGDKIGDKEILVVSFGTSFNDKRVACIGSIEKDVQEANPDWAVRRAFTSQIIMNHIFARDGEKIDNIKQALARAEENKVKELVVVPTHLMKGKEYDEVVEAINEYKDKFDSLKFAEPLLGEVGKDASVINEDKERCAKAVTKAAVKDAKYDDLDAAEKDGTAFVFMGHGTSHEANITYDQMQKQMDELGYKNVFIGTVEGEPEDTACDKVIEKVKKAGYKKVILRPLMVVAGDHAHNDMADADDPESWVSQFTAAKAFDSVDCQITGLGEIKAIQEMYVDHAKDAINK